MDNKWKDLLFKPVEIIGFKKEADDPNVYTFDTELTQFYIVNPLKSASGSKLASKANIAAFRNIVVEFDKMKTINEQQRFVDKSEMPFTLAVHSGNKSVHFIVSLEEDLDSEADYTLLANMIYAAMGGAPDPKCKNINRLTRTPNITRIDTQKQQSILETRTKVNNEALLSWLYSGPRSKHVKKYLAERERMQEENARRAAEITETGEKRAIPAIYAAIINEGALHPETTSRHDSLVKLAVWLQHNGYSEEEVMDNVFKAEQSLGIPLQRRDAEGVLTWLYGRI